jgi:DNA polymerase III alpha subunit
MERLEGLCKERLTQLGLTEEKHLNRLTQELKEIAAKKDADYFLDLYDRKVRFAKNDHNLMVAYLLKLCKSYEASKQPEYTTPEWPDIDVDYLPEVRGYLKEIYAPKAFGEEFCCNIGSYNTYGLKSALIDMARVFGEDRDEILRITTQLGLKDDEGHVLTWEKALDLYPPLKEWVDKHWWAEDPDGNKIPGPAQAAKNLIYSDIDWHKFDYKGEPPHRNRSMGMHAGGLIISSKPIHEIVPLVRGKDGSRASAWVEGLSGQDLTLVGLVKYDFLVIDALKKIANCVRLIRERHGIDKFMAVEGGMNWSDTDRWINDAKCIETANRGDLKMVFQFDSDGIRELARKGGVTSFDDIVAYTSLYRPGPMDVGMHEEYCLRKKYKLGQPGGKPYELHPVMEELIGKTYGVMLFQEDVMKVFNKVGKIPLEECQPIIKAISKKNKAKFEKFKEMFIQNAQVTLGIDEHGAVNLWDQIESFAGYGFNAGHATAYSYLSWMMLFLKVHYPIEFYASVMSALPTADERLKEYKQDAEKHGVVIEPLNINLSKQEFAIIGPNYPKAHPEDKIYWALGKIKGIGEESAAELEKHQPYRDFKDFLVRFGTNGVVLKPVVALRCFKDQKALDTFKFYCQFKDKEKKKMDRTKRFEKTIMKYRTMFREMVGVDPYEVGWENALYRAHDNTCVEDYMALKKKHDRSVENYEKKGDLSFQMSDYDPQKEADIAEEYLASLTDIEQAEITYYGFLWKHPLEKSPNYTGCTFERYREEIARGITCCEVEVLIKKVHENKSKKGTVYFQLEVEDAHGEFARINVWDEDFKLYQEELVEKNMVRLRVNPPSGGFKTYTFESFPKWKRPKNIDKAFDARCIVLPRKVEEE